MDSDSGEMFLLGEEADSWHTAFSQKPLQDWAGDPDCVLNQSESEDVLHAVDPNEVFPSGPLAASSSESDSGISEDPAPGRPVSTAPPTVYQLVYEVNSLQTNPGTDNVISIELGEWSSQVLFSDSCIVNELPVVAAARLDGSGGADPLYPELQLTEEEQKLLIQEGVSLPNSLPLTKAEERVLKRVRRKIRNKQSAQDSRRRRKDYIDGLESRAVACSVQNKELQRTVDQLEKRNMSLLAHLQQLQSLIKHTVSRGAQTSTCLLIILVSLGLIILPSFSPFSRNPSADDDYRPTGVISRNILTEHPADGPAVQSDPPSAPSEPGEPAAPPDGPALLQQPIESLGNPGSDVAAAEGNSSGAGVRTPAIPDPAKPAHADEM
ncbi:hypothetical protein PBY51_017121 [Eleginops maclovinus]|uniref:Cyclic AMP-responsive element-binding protein 3-like protein 4 n=2 Tax=Eleginops maclovinus TaxID=56733 RepID=A0AAN7XEB5_ELEMC|nr:hypothetical protein PBY51_017121 [Eleginops maclovinus]